MIDLVKVLSQHVDTLVTHYYPNGILEEKDIKDYNTLVNDLKSQKSQAQEIKADNNDIRFIKTTIGNESFNVMSSSVRGFSVTIKNDDISISFRNIKNVTNKTPLVKIEYRAKFLVKAGYVSCIKYVNDFFKKNILNNYEIKIARIDLACDIQGYNFNIRDMFKIQTRARTKKLHLNDTDDNQTTFYLNGYSSVSMDIGSSNYRLRIYDKTVETQKNKNKAFIKDLVWIKHPDYKPKETVYRIEVQYRREKLKQLADSKNGLLDGFTNVLNSIPSLWKKAMEDFKLKDIPRDKLDEIMDGYKTIKWRDGKKLEEPYQVPLSKKAISNRIREAPISDFWLNLNTFNSYEGSEIEIFRNQTAVHEDYLFNSIKGTLGLLGNHYGDISTDNLIKAFMSANSDSIEKKNMTLVESVNLRQIEKLGKVELHLQKYGEYIPVHEDLENNLRTELLKATDLIDFGRTEQGTIELIESFIKLQNRRTA